MYREGYDRAGFLIFPGNNAASFLGAPTFVPAVGLFIVGLKSAGANGGGILEYSAMAIPGSGLLITPIGRFSFARESRLANC